MEKIIYVDEEESARKDVVRDLSSSGLLDVHAIPPPQSPETTGEILSGEWDLYLLDYLLNMQQESGQSVNYRGVTLASALRETLREHPIVVVSRKGLANWKADERLVARMNVFDAVMFKSDIGEDPEKSARELKRLSKGFQQLRQATDRTWVGLLALLSATQEREGGILLQASPPLLSNGHQMTWNVLEIAGWLNDSLFYYPGVLLDSLHAATLLGITQDSLRKEPVQLFLQEARYDGVMAPLSGRWWRQRLLRLARALTRKHSAGSFREAFQLETQVELGEAKCVHCGEGPADWVCYILNQPVKLEHSLAYHPDQRPVVMEEARVSFTAVIETNEVHDEFFEDEDLEMARLLRREAQNA